MTACQRIALLAAVLSIGGLACEPEFSAKPRRPSRPPAELLERHHEKAMVRLSRECKAGKKLSCSLAAASYEHGEAPVDAPGEIVPQDLTRAAYYWSKGCELGDMWCCRNLAAANEKGEGIKKDDVEAARLYTRVCEGPLDTVTKFACASLGEQYVSGKGVRVDFRKGISLLARACSMGADYSCKLHDIYAGTGTVTETSPPEGSLGFTFGWSKEIAQKTCADRDGRWLPAGEKGGVMTMVCKMRVGVLDRDADVGLDFVDGRLANIWALYNVDEATAVAEHARLVDMLFKVYGTPGKRTFEVLDGCRDRSLTTCIKEKQATFSVYWEFADHANSVSAALIVDKDEKLAVILMYMSPAGMKAAGHPGL
jgi:hypothetical protein